MVSRRKRPVLNVTAVSYWLFNITHCVNRVHMLLDKVERLLQTFHIAGASWGARFRAEGLTEWRVKQLQEELQNLRTTQNEYLLMR